jgi:hypothetical protein
MDRIPVGARFFSPVETGPGVLPAFCRMDTGSFPGVKQSGRGVDHPPHLAPRLKNLDVHVLLLGKLTVLF